MDLKLPNLGLTVYNRYDLLERFFNGIDIHIDKISVIINNRKLKNEKIISDIQKKFPQTEFLDCGYNIGISASWNLLIKKCLIEGDQFSFISQDDMSFSSGELKKVANHFQNNQDADIITYWGFGLFCVSKRCIEKVGFFDENFYPAYYEDTDYCRRMTLCKENLKIKENKIQAIHGDEQSINGGCTTNTVKNGTVCAGVNSLRYTLKWGGTHTNETYITPYNNPNLTIKDWTVDISSILTNRWES